MNDCNAKQRFSANISRFAAYLGDSRGLVRYGTAFLTGISVTLSLPPFEFLPAFYAALPVFIWSVSGKVRPWCLFATGWWFGFGYFVSGLYWIGSAMLVDASKNAWLIPLASVGLPAFLSLFFGLSVLPVRFGNDHFSRALILTTSLGFAEWTRGNFLTGFPWNLLGQAWASHDTLLQGVSLVGIYGMTFFALLSGFLLAVLAQELSKATLAIFAVALMLPISFATYGAIRLAHAPVVGADWVEGVGIRLVQGGIPQKEKWDRRYLVRNFKKHIFLSNRDRPDWINYVIWPETASPFPLDNNDGARAAASAIVPREGALITGMIRRQVGSEKKIWNSIIALDDRAKIIAKYDKSHLVPFGEYVPGKKWLSLKKVTEGRLDYSAGPGPSIWRLGVLPPVSPLICYEIIFSGTVTPVDQRADWILVLTNDAWYGNSSGPYQHLSIARIRAAEEGLTVVRAASTGISAVFDGYGREWSRIELDKTGVLDTRLPSSSRIYSFWAQNSQISTIIFTSLSFLAFLMRKGVKRTSPHPGMKAKKK
ncbi:MAG: apolipoprotein N-acyltransferase [Pseudomonadota bacterium]|nr:apolipoprotein N-acyltransferase [Pseudomonadota bacterium]